MCTARPLRDVGSVSICRALSDIIEEKGAHQRYQCDGAICTKHSLEREMLTNMGVDIQVGAPYTSRHQCGVESLNKKIFQGLVKSLFNVGSISLWPQHLGAVCLALNTAPVESLGYLSPHQVIYHFAPYVFMKGFGPLHYVLEVCHNTLFSKVKTSKI